MKLSQLGMPSGLPLVHLHPTSVVELGWMSKMLASVRDRLSPNREGCFQWKKKKNPWLWMPLFSLLQMGASCSKTTPLKCI